MARQRETKVRSNKAIIVLKLLLRYLKLLTASGIHPRDSNKGEDKTESVLQRVAQLSTAPSCRVPVSLPRIRRVTDCRSTDVAVSRSRNLIPLREGNVVLPVSLHVYCSPDTRRLDVKFISGQVREEQTIENSSRLGMESSISDFLFFFFSSQALMTPKQLAVR